MDGERGNRELLFNGHRISLWEDDEVLEMKGSDGYTTMLMYLKPSSTL